MPTTWSRLLLPLAAMLLATGPAAAAREATAITPLYHATHAGRTVTLTRNDLQFGRVGTAAPLVSLRAAWLHGLGDPAGGDEQHDVSWRLLSRVGPLVSVETHADGYAEGAAHPYAYADVTAYDLRTGKPAVLTTWFAAQDVHAALLRDALVQRALAATRPRPATLERLLGAIQGYQSEDCTWGFSADLLSRFAFHHVRGDRVAVRFGLSHGCEVARGQLTILAVYLPIPPALRADLAAARAGTAGFLVPGAPVGEARAALKRGKGARP